MGENKKTAEDKGTTNITQQTSTAENGTELSDEQLENTAGGKANWKLADREDVSRRYYE